MAEDGRRSNREDESSEDGISKLKSESQIQQHRAEEDEAAMKGWLLKQFYQPKVYKRVWQANKETTKRVLDDMVSEGSEFNI